MGKRVFSIVSIAALAFLVMGCSFILRRCTEPGENATLHYLGGMELLEQGDIEGASYRFERAICCDRKYGPAYGGLAVTTALKAVTTDSPGGRAFYDLELACDYSDTKEELFACKLASMRVYTLLKPAGWLRMVEDGYRTAMKLKVDESGILFYNGREAAMYFMGLAYLEAGMPVPAHDRFMDVLMEKRKGRWVGYAKAMIRNER